MEQLERFLVIAPVLLFSMVAHEYAHGYAAFKQGDPTAYQLGRLTWNPLKHIDPFMTVILPTLTWFAGGFLFGGAKPVPVIPRNYRNYRSGDIIVSLAGIAANIAIAALCVVLAIAIGVVGRAVPPATESLAIVQYMMEIGIFFNLLLAMFNLLPLPPLDGSHVVKHLLPPAWAVRYQQIGMYGILILIFIMATGIGRGLLIAWLTPVYLLTDYAGAILRRWNLYSSFLGT
ncbi:MAG: site-2 protease family protein [Gemmatimonadota bacterium]